jgi:hypothetical protein
MTRLDTGDLQRCAWLVVEIPTSELGPSFPVEGTSEGGTFHGISEAFGDLKKRLKEAPGLFGSLCPHLVAHAGNGAPFERLGASYT